MSHYLDRKHIFECSLSFSLISVEILKRDIYDKYVIKPMHIPINFN